MTMPSPYCIASYDFNHIVDSTRRRFIDGCSSIKLLQQAKSNIEREEIALVSILDIEHDFVLDIQLDCPHANDCSVANCRDTLRRLIESRLKFRY